MNVLFVAFQESNYTVNLSFLKRCRDRSGPSLTLNHFDRLLL
jgi:hypothetical protein